MWNTDPWVIALILIGIAGIGLGAFYAWLAAGAKNKLHGGYIAAFGFVVVLFALAGSALIPSAVVTGPSTATAAQSLSTYVSTGAVTGVAPALPSACTNYPNSATVTCTFGYNSTQKGFQLALSNTTDLGYTPGAAGTLYASLNYLDVALHSARTDQVNSTFLFTYTYQSLPTFAGIGNALGTTCSPVGFTTATSSLQGQWQVKFHSGQNGNLLPTQAAPATSSGVGADPTAIAGFGSITQVAQISFAGGNGTSAAFGCWSALSLYQALTVTISTSQSTPPIETINLLPLGYNT